MTRGGGGRVPARQVRGGGVETALSYTECMEKWGGGITPNSTHT
jgi:hypothetical protein